MRLLLLLLSMELGHDRRTHFLKILLFFFVFFLILQGIPFAQSHHLLSLSFTVSRSAAFSLLSTFGSSAIPVLHCTHNFPSCLSKQSFLSQHAIDARFRQPSGVIGDGDGIGSFSSLADTTKIPFASISRETSIVVNPVVRG